MDPIYESYKEISEATTSDIKNKRNNSTGLNFNAITSEKIRDALAYAAVLADGMVDYIAWQCNGIHIYGSDFARDKKTYLKTADDNLRMLENFYKEAKKAIEESKKEVTSLTDYPSN